MPDIVAYIEVDTLTSNNDILYSTTVLSYQFFSVYLQHVKSYPGTTRQNVEKGLQQDEY